MKRVYAENLTKTFLQLSTDLNAITFDYLKDSGSDDPAYLKFRGGVGQVLGIFYTDIMMNVFKEFPDLEPADLQDDEGDDEDE